MVGVPVSFKGATAFRGEGFKIELDSRSVDLAQEMARGGLAIRGASVEAVVKTTETIKERVRNYIDAQFSNSAYSGNGRRRAANASAQTKYFNDLADKGQYTGLVYSKFGRGRGRDNFVDFLLFHKKGGTIAPKRGDWLRIPNKRVGGIFGAAARTGRFADVDARVFFLKSRDGQKLFLLRRYGAAAPGSVSRSTQLLATLVPQVQLPSRLSGLDGLGRDRAELFEKFFDAELAAKGIFG